MKDTQAQDDSNREGEWPAEGDTRFPVFEAVPSKSGRGRRRRGGGLGAERGEREISPNQAGGGDEKDGGTGRSSKGSSSGRSSSVPPLQRQPVDPWAEAPALWQLFGS